MKKTDLLLRLGWPTDYTNSRGSLVWQNALDEENQKTVSLSNTDQTIKLSVLTLGSFGTLIPTLLAEWDATDNECVMKKCLYNGQDLFATYPTNLVEDKAIEEFLLAVETIDLPPQIDIKTLQSDLKLPDLSS